MQIPLLVFIQISMNRKKNIQLLNALILTWCRFRLLHLNFCLFITELWPLIDVRISFPLNILKTNWLIFTKFCNALILSRSTLGLLGINFSLIYIRVELLINVRISFPLNIFRTNWWSRVRTYVTYKMCNICQNIRFTRIWDYVLSELMLHMKMCNVRIYVTHEYEMFCVRT